MIKRIENSSKILGMPAKFYVGAAMVVVVISALAVINNTVLVSAASSAPESTVNAANIQNAGAITQSTSTGLTQIYSYEVMYSSNTFVPRIWLRNSTAAYIGQLIFEPNGAVLPADGISNGQVNLYYHLQDFDNAIDLLRNEGPVYLLYSGSGTGYENGLRVYPNSVGSGKLKEYVTTTYK